MRSVSGLYVTRTQYVGVRRTSGITETAYPKLATLTSTCFVIGERMCYNSWRSQSVFLGRTQENARISTRL